MGTGFAYCGQGVQVRGKIIAANAKLELQNYIANVERHQSMKRSVWVLFLNYIVFIYSLCVSVWGAHVP